MSDLSPEQQLREDAWAALMKMREDPDTMVASGGWCSPSEAVYETDIVIRNAAGQVAISYP